MDEVNVALWKMHTRNQYSKNYKEYLNILYDNAKKSKDISYLDTIAWVYKDNKNKQKAIQIFEKEILPISRALKNEKKKNTFEEYYKKIKN